jgi:MIP family channel proteins
MYSLPQKLAAEFIGTFVLVFVAAGSVCADQFLSANGQSRAGLLGIAVAQGLAYAVMIAALGHISGGHFNPAVTIGFWVTRRLGTFRSIFYWAAQFLGALAAAYAIKSILPDSGWSVRALGAITPDLGGDFTRAQGIELETIMTFFLVFIFFATVADAKSFSGRVAGFVVGLAFTMDILMGGPFTGAGLNPARVLGPAIATRHWGNHGVYWVGPLLGGVLAAFIYDRFFLRDQPAA